jgi:dihydrolipoamide dehydrogenase
LVVTYREAIIQTTCPKNVVIIGGGAIGVEFAYIYRAYGANVTIVEMEGSLLPREDEEISKLLTRSLEQQGIKALTGAKVMNVQRDSNDDAIVALQTSEGIEQINADRVLIAIGIQANLEGLNLDKVAVQIEKGFIKVDQNLQTTGESIYAIGDVTGIKPLAHVAQAQGIFVAEHIAGEQSSQLDYSNMPSAVYCVPQVASMGITEQEARSNGLNHKIGRFPFVANGKALALGETDGLAKVIVDEDSGELLGAHLIGHEVTELLGELSLTRLMEGTHIEVGAVVNAHPSISEAIKEAALAATGKAIHI